jgi:hypothetical protein
MLFIDYVHCFYISILFPFCEAVFLPYFCEKVLYDPFYPLENMVRCDITMKSTLVPVPKIYGVEKRKIVETRDIKAAKLTNEERVKEISTGSPIKC